MKAIGISGSPHKNGNSVYLIKEVLKTLESVFDTELIFLKNYDIKPCNGCQSCDKNGICVIEDDMQILYTKIKDSRVIILSSPSYMGGVTSRLRIFMERTWHLRKGQLDGKIGSYIVVGRRRLGAAGYEIEEYLSRLGLTKFPGVTGFAYKKGDISKDKEALKDAKRLGRQILDKFI
jgi:multimeric flavodoxin WrbA